MKNYFEIILNINTNLEREEIRTLIKKAFQKSAGLKYIDMSKINLTHITIKKEQ